MRNSRLVWILGEDASRLYLWKPAGLPVFPPHADPGGDCVLAQLTALRPNRSDPWPEGFAGGIAHRLDNATSGLILVARTLADLPPLRAEFREGRLRKLYRFRASVAPQGRRVIEVPLAHHPRRKDRMVAQRGPRTAHRGRWYPAWTALRHLDGPWWEAEIRTGVMHQVRVHAAFAGAALDGDPIYGDPARAELPYALHHAQVIGPGWASPTAPMPEPPG